MNWIKEIVRYAVGALFIFSGLIKVNDPVGTAIKLEEYFEVFAYDFAPFFEWFIPAALFLSVVLSVLEVALGIALLARYRMNITTWVLLIIIVFFTFLTFYSAYFNKVTDCGCFGDAIKFTPWQSFTKDIILLVLIGYLFGIRHTFNSRTDRQLDIRLSAIVGILIFLAINAIRHLPFIDFRSYAVGNNLPELMQPSGELQYEYVMEKDGKTVRLEAYPSDPSYTFISMEILNPEVQPKITDLAVWNDDGDFTEDLLSGTKLLLIVHGVSKTSDKNKDEIADLLGSIGGLDAWALTSSGSDEYEPFAKQMGWSIPYFYTDATVLKTIIRSSPGLVLLQNGVVLGKWHYNDVPAKSDIERLIN